MTKTTAKTIVVIICHDGRECHTEIECDSTRQLRKEIRFVTKMCERLCRRGTIVRYTILTDLQLAGTK